MNLEAKRMREQLLSVITHAQVTIFTVDTHFEITMVEGSFLQELIRAVGGNISPLESPVEKNIFDVFHGIDPNLRPGIETFLAPIRDIVTGAIVEDTVEHSLGKSD
jgi:hypothetical protein